MPIDHIVAELIAERDKLNRAIEALTGTNHKRRGRPPKNPLAIPAAASNLAPPVARKARTFTASQRKEQAERMKKYWAARRKTKK